MNTINSILKTASLQVLPFLSAWLSSTIERIDKAGDAFVDRVSPAEPAGFGLEKAMSCSSGP